MWNSTRATLGAIVVHCEQGVSRSPAVAAALCDALGLDGRRFWHGYQPNKHVSHPHQDHYGLAHRLPKETKFLIGAAAERILAAAEVLSPAGLRFQNVSHLVDRTPMLIGPFKITPYLVDHSAFDAYAILVEADGKATNIGAFLFGAERSSLDAYGFGKSALRAVKACSNRSFVAASTFAFKPDRCSMKYRAGR